jgi:hypothetical protein
VHVEEGGVSLDHSLTPAEIGAVRARIGRGAAMLPAWRTVGLTVAEFSVGKATKGRMSAAGPGKWCVQVTNITLRIGFTKQTVYIPRNYPAGSCEYAAVEAHEAAHVADNLAVLDDFTHAITEKAESAALTLNPVIVTSRKQARERPVELLTQSLAPLIKDLHAAQAARAAVRDSPEEYAAISRLCRNW